MTDERDPMLQARFDALRTADSMSAPSFERMTHPSALDRRRRHLLSRRHGGFLALASLAIVATVSLRTWLTREPENLLGIDMGSVYWRAPSDFLLDTPGRDLLYQIPYLLETVQPVPPSSTEPVESTATNRMRPPT